MRAVPFMVVGDEYLDMELSMDCARENSAFYGGGRCVVGHGFVQYFAFCHCSFHFHFFTILASAYIFFDLNFFFLISNKSLYVVAEVQYLVVQPIRSLYDFLIF